MAKAVGLIGTLKGKIGNTVFATLRGETIARVYQPTVTNPNTYRQQVSRVRMSSAGLMAKAVLKALQIGFNNAAPGREFQQGVKNFNTPAAIQIAALDEVTVNYPLLKMSKDETGLFNTSGLDLDAENKVTFSYNVPEEVAFGPESVQDKFGLVPIIYQPDTNACVVAPQAVSDKVGTLTVDVPAEWSGMTVQVWVFAKRLLPSKNGVPFSNYAWRTPSKASATMYVGMGTLA